jgi:hypothetical protein
MTDFLEMAALGILDSGPSRFVEQPEVIHGAFVPATAN